MTNDQPPEGPAPALFLVELRAALGVRTSLDGMQRDLTTALARLRRAGVAIRGTAAVLLPDDARCLYLVEAADTASVALACDSAGLTAAPVHEAYAVPAGPWPPVWPAAPAAPTDATGTPPARPEPHDPPEKEPLP